MAKNVWIGRVIFLAIIIIISLYVMIWSGNIRCSKLPAGCDIYWGIQSKITGKNQPSVLILYDPEDNEALGDAELLKKLLTNRDIAGVHPNMGNINYLSSDQLLNTSLIIVDQARKISTTNLITFMNYVNQGGRLVWIGDSGTQKTIEDEFFVNPITKEYNGWRRVTDDNMLIRFNSFLGVEYIDKFCNIKDCSEGIKTGELISQSDHLLVRGLREDLEIYDDYALVKVIESNPTPLKVDYGSNIIDNKTHKDYGNIFPLIVTSNSNRVAYYAIPPEYLCEDDDENKYLLIIENLIKGMLN
jgi:hypothetical protein